jgi:hypothetical protein
MDCTEWHPYFAWFPVTVDAYTESERRDGKFSYPKLGWVERRLDIWIDDDDERTEKRVWRFRLPRSPQGSEEANG